MKSLILFSYKQPHEMPNKFRWGVLNSVRDTDKEPLCWDTIHGQYRKWDSDFERSQHLLNVQTRQGPKAFYGERTNWKIKIPFVGSLVSRFLPA